MADLTFGTSIPTARLPGIGASIRILVSGQVERQVILKSGNFGKFYPCWRLQSVLRNARANIGPFHLDFDIEVLEGVMNRLGIAVNVTGVSFVLLLIE